MTRRGRLKCKKCDGRGGWTVKLGEFLREVFLACPECLGRGTWWPNNQQRRRGR